ncbi:hypothetical protein D3C73_1375630 [compost metagenome]
MNVIQHVQQNDTTFPRTLHNFIDDIIRTIGGVPIQCCNVIHCNLRISYSSNRLGSLIINHSSRWAEQHDRLLLNRLGYDLMRLYQILLQLLGSQRRYNRMGIGMVCYLMPLGNHRSCQIRVALYPFGT